jgi:MYXO-CTERM domain-containing protein
MRRLAFALAILFSERAAEAACQRPADMGGYAGYDYAPATPMSFDGALVKIWYVTTGPHAVNTATTRMDMVPDNVARAAAVGDDALTRYGKMGFRAPVSDGTCGGDGKVDIYLVHFNAADGDETAETCTPMGKASVCSSFGLVEAKMEQIYGSFDLGARTVIPHEMFHGIQDAYDQNVSRFWAEGTAQWATKTLDPSVMDLEANLPGFFARADASIDVVTGGVTGEFLYGSAIFPVFLTEKVGPDAVKNALGQEAMVGPPSMDSIANALEAMGTSMAEEYPTFTSWNCGTGKRAGTGGYKNAAKYPMAMIGTFPDTNEATGIITGYSSFFYAYDFGADTYQVTLEGDPIRISGRTFPLENGKARLDQLAKFPALVTGAGIFVVSGVSGKKTDAPFTLRAAVPMADAGVDSGTMPPPPPPMSSGCSCSHARASSDGWPIAFALVFVLRRGRRRRA